MRTNNHRRGRGGKFIFFPIIGAGMVLLFGAIVRLLWNAIMPDITHASRITYWQAVGLLVLCRILVGGFGRGGMRGRGPMGNRGAEWRDKWMKMTPDEREQLRHQWKERCRVRKSGQSDEEKDITI